jgi:acyl-coenzyme A thioesterase PaaI-like protein
MPGTTVAPMAGRVKDMDRWLGDGGMEVIGLVGASFVDYGVDGEDLGWVTGTWIPTTLACNPHGTAQAGIHSLVLDAAMNFAINAALPGRARTRGTLEMKTETMRPAALDAPFAVRGEVVRMARQGAYGEASVRDGDGLLVSRATGTFLLHRPDPPPGAAVSAPGP